MNLDRDFKTTIRVSTILEYLKRNKEQHVQSYAVAREKYFEAVEKRLKGFLKSARNQEDRSYDVGLKSPVDYSHEYDKLILLFSASEDETVELSQKDANMILNNTFDWAVMSDELNKFYSEANSAFTAALSKY